ncbi:mitochondrial ribosomal small subunit [Coprinopsis cinerea okayama7|uniref:Small ribosomal subunit protein uS10m n=1 Tax=Coprinopsis cinerea (strain Okayama-7 / 130 / ATCC MYA-4618 / FGSC 9003) TaxID=240176 RepID=A8PBM2_COPC7|nr:mitochondrial ribosomal small subunit [Coprinopsis cinerea okayama7\|eukprot:XP_001840218.2 mitochondrial ribosomal small subunit [Coprinopsis cinerea okayama7\
MLLRASLGSRTRSWAAPSVARWARYQSSTAGSPGAGPGAAGAGAGAGQPAQQPSATPEAELASSKPAEAAKAGGANANAPGATVQRTPQEADAAVDKMLEDAVLNAYKTIEAEMEKPEMTKVEGYDGPITNAALPPNAKYNPADLPLPPPSSTTTSPSSRKPLTEEQWSATLIHGRSTLEPLYHPAPYHIPVASLHLRSYHPKLLDFFSHFAAHAAAALGIPISKTAHLPTQRSLWTVPRSPFAHKKSQENFERRTHKRAIKAWDAAPEVVDRWCDYLRRHSMAGVGLKVTRWDRMPLGLGAGKEGEGEAELSAKARMEIEQRPSEAVKVLAEKIVKKEGGKVKPAA